MILKKAYSLLITLLALWGKGINWFSFNNGGVVEKIRRRVGSSLSYFETMVSNVRLGSLYSPCCMKKVYKRGFNLVELAIALSVIGILVASSRGIKGMVDAKNVTQVLYDIQKYSNQVEEFRMTYGWWPADLYPCELTGKIGCPAGNEEYCNYRGFPDCNNATGTVNVPHSNKYLVDKAYTRAFAVDADFFRQLSMFHMNSDVARIGASYSMNDEGNIGVNDEDNIGVLLPRSQLGEKTFYAIANVHTNSSLVSNVNFLKNENGFSNNTFGTGDIKGNFLALMIYDLNYPFNGYQAKSDTYRVGNPQFRYSASIPVNLAFLIDKKGDDGKPYTGRIVAMGYSAQNGANNGFYYGSKCSTEDVIGDDNIITIAPAAASKYDTSNKRNRCSLAFLIDTAK